MSISRMLDLMMAPYGVYAVDMNQTIVFWNHSAERILGYTRDEVLDRHCNKLCAGSPEEETQGICIDGCPMIQLAREGIIPPVAHALMRSSSGELKPVTVTSIIYRRDEDDEKNLLVHLFHERTDDALAKTLAQNIHDVFSEEEDPQETLPDEYKPLSDRESEVLRLLALAVTPEEIAERLELSPHTILNHIRNARRKLNAKNRLEAVVIAQRNRLL